MKNISLEVAVCADWWSRLRGVDLPTQVQATFPIEKQLEGVDNITVNMACGLNLAGKWGCCVGSCLKRKRGA